MSEPIRSRPEMPESYGVAQGEEGMLPWSFVLERLPVPRNYWACTVRPDGRPHATPVWGVFVDGVFYFGGGHDTRRARNLDHNPHVVIHLESGDEVVIVEGVTEKFTEANADPALLVKVDDAYEAKYGMRHGTPVWAVRPKVVLAWTDFATTPTRWKFE